MCFELNVIVFGQWGKTKNCWKPLGMETRRWWKRFLPKEQKGVALLQGRPRSLHIQIQMIMSILLSFLRIVRLIGRTLKFDKSLNYLYEGIHSKLPYGCTEIVNLEQHNCKGQHYFFKYVNITTHFKILWKFNPSAERMPHYFCGNR